MCTTAQGRMCKRLLWSWALKRHMPRGTHLGLSEAPTSALGPDGGGGLLHLSLVVSKLLVELGQGMGKFPHHHHHTHAHMLH